MPYTVTNTTHHVTSTAFIHVPAYGVFPPMLRPKAPEIIVNARQTVHININDYVRVGAGKEPYLESADSITATKASNTDFRVDGKTLKFTAIKDYAGPASITFTVTDGNRPDASAIINTAVVTLPITVLGRTTPPPTFSSPTIDIEAGAEPKTIDLTALTHMLRSISCPRCPAQASCISRHPKMRPPESPPLFPCTSHTARARCMPA